jgi:DNA-binding transcriptional MerR regulator
MLNERPNTRRPFGHFSIKAVSKATGLTVETLRAWERRYAVVQPVRDPSGRRSYAAADIARLRLLRAATELGHPIGRIASLPGDELARLVADSGGVARGPARGDSYVARVIDAAEHSDPVGVEEVLTSAFALLSPSEVLNGVIVPLVKEIGDRWHRGALSIAQEHMVTDILRRLMITASRSFVRADNGPCLVLATLCGERHELGLLMCSWLAAARRYRTHYLGADCPPEEVARFTLDVEARAVLVSLVMPENQVPVLQHLNDLALLLRGKAEVWVGGMAARSLAPESVPRGCVILPSMPDLETRLDLLAHQYS